MKITICHIQEKMNPKNVATTPPTPTSKPTKLKVNGPLLDRHAEQKDPTTSNINLSGLLCRNNGYAVFQLYRGMLKFHKLVSSAIRSLEIKHICALPKTLTY